MLSSLICCLFYALLNSFLANYDPFFHLSFNLKYIYIYSCTNVLLLYRMKLDVD